MLQIIRGVVTVSAASAWRPGEQETETECTLSLADSGPGQPRLCLGLARALQLTFSSPGLASQLVREKDLEIITCSIIA